MVGEEHERGLEQSHPRGIGGLRREPRPEPPGDGRAGGSLRRIVHQRQRADDRRDEGAAGHGDRDRPTVVAQVVGGAGRQDDGPQPVHHRGGSKAATARVAASSPAGDASNGTATRSPVQSHDATSSKVAPERTASTTSQPR